MRISRQSTPTLAATEAHPGNSGVVWATCPNQLRSTMHPDGVGPPQPTDTQPPSRRLERSSAGSGSCWRRPCSSPRRRVGLSQRQQPLYRASSQVLAEVPEPGERPHRHPEPVRRVPGSRAERADADSGRDVACGRAACRGACAGARAHPRRLPARRVRYRRVELGHAQLCGHLPDPGIAQRLSTLHAQQYIAYRQELDSAALVAARKELEGRIAELRAGSAEGTPRCSPS